MKLDIDAINGPSTPIKQSVVRIRATSSKISKFKLGGVHVFPIDFLKGQLSASANNQIAENLSCVFPDLVVWLYFTKQSIDDIASINEVFECLT